MDKQWACLYDVIHAVNFCSLMSDVTVFYYFKVTRTSETKVGSYIAISHTKHNCMPHKSSSRNIKIKLNKSLARKCQQSLTFTFYKSNYPAWGEIIRNTIYLLAVYNTQRFWEPQIICQLRLSVPYNTKYIKRLVSIGCNTWSITKLTSTVSRMDYALSIHHC